ncbi:MAG: nucleotidyl transferase AbiEii/AbiGii toxin family protein [Leptospiraceae bacterium]|nr:nucleotidyl transferase AbiEii/AbiGii toxin family protein [Leptospiraceae bacterium]
MLKLASPEQREFYETILYPMQDVIFSLLQSDKFYLTGGTCLSRFYFNHRYSDDLDFFFMGQEDELEIFELECNKVFQRIETDFKLEVSINNKSFKRIFAYKNENPLKIEFIYENFPLIGNRIKEKGILLDTKSNIASNKITAIHDRKTYKDYFDLFFLLKEFDLKDLLKWAELKKVPLDYEGTLLSLSLGELEGDVFMIQNIKEPDFKEFMKKLTGEILKHAKEIS